MASKKISQLNAIVDVSNLDFLPIVDQSSDETKKITIQQLIDIIDLDTKAILGQITGDIADQTDLIAILDDKAEVADLSGHISDSNNPHNVTKAQVGLDNVTNDAQVRRDEMGAINGVATLGADQKILSSQLPALAITDTFVVSSEFDMLSLSAEIGDVAIRTDLNKSFILSADNPAILSNWQELLTPTDQVSSVNGQTGVVNLTTSDIPEGSNLYYEKLRTKEDGFITDDDVMIISDDYTASDFSEHIVVTQPCIIYLPQIQAVNIRKAVTNKSNGEVTVMAFSGDLVHDDTNLIISNYKSTAQLKSTSLGWLVV